MVLSVKVGRLNGKASGKRFLVGMETSACDWLWLPRMKMPRHKVLASDEEVDPGHCVFEVLV